MPLLPFVDSGKLDDHLKTAFGKRKDGECRTKLQSDIEAACPGIPVRAFSAADSTDAQALRALSAGETGPVIFSALEQTGDRAAGDSFSSHEGFRRIFPLFLGPGASA